MTRGAARRDACAASQRWHVRLASVQRAVAASVVPAAVCVVLSALACVLCSPAAAPRRERRHPRPRRLRRAAAGGGAPARRRRPRRAAGTRRTDRPRSVVYLESAPRGAFEQTEPGRAVMDQRNETFVPHVLAITTGTTVDFPNSDRIYHNVFSLSKAARFDLGRYAAGQSKSVRFDRPGHRPRVLRHPLAHERVHPRLQPSVLRDDRRRRPLPDRQRAARHLQRRSPGTKGVASEPQAGRRSPTAASPSSTSRSDEAVCSSLRSRIFLASALLAVLSIGVAIYLVSVARDRARPRTALQREIVATGALVDQLRTTRAETFTHDGAAHRRRAEAEGGGRHQRSADGPGHRRRLPGRSSSRTCCSSPTGPAACWRPSARRRAAAHVVASQPAVRDGAAGRESFSLLPQPDGMLQLVTVPIAIGLDAARHPRHAQRRLPARRRAGGAAEGRSPAATSRSAWTGRSWRRTLPREDRPALGDAAPPRRATPATCTLGDRGVRRAAAAARRRHRRRRDRRAGPVALILRSRTEQLRFLQRDPHRAGA